MDIRPVKQDILEQRVTLSVVPFKPWSSTNAPQGRAFLGEDLALVRAHPPKFSRPGQIFCDGTTVRFSISNLQEDSSVWPRHFTKSRNRYQRRESVRAMRCMSTAEMRRDCEPLEQEKTNFRSWLPPPTEQINHTVRTGISVWEFVMTDLSKVDRVAWFKSAMETSSGPLSDEDLHDLTKRYVFLQNMCLLGHPR